MRELRPHEAGVVAALEAVQYPHFPDGQGGRLGGLFAEDAGDTPARGGVVLHHWGQQPRYWAEREHGMGARGEARPLIQQVLGGAAGFDGKDIHIRIFRCPTEIEPESVG